MEIRIHSTKVLDPSFGDALRDAGMVYEEADFIKAHPLPFILPSDYSPENEHAIVFTSSNAVKVIAPHAAEIPGPIFCLQGKTREAVEAVFGADRIVSTAPNAVTLAATIVATAHFKAVTFFCGRKHLDALPDTLRENKLEVREVVVYETFGTPFEFEEIPHGILFFSPTAAEYYFWENLLDELTVVFATGETTAKTLRDIVGDDQKIIVAPQPGAEAMIQTVITYFKLNPIDLTPE